MEVYIYLIPPTLLMLVIIIYIFFWALKNKQYNDLEGESFRFLNQEERNHKNK